MAVKYDADKMRRDTPLSEYLPTRGIGLKADGNEWRACCPFHSESTPSFCVYPGKKGTQEFQCFGCDAKGDVFEFVQKYDGVGFREACEILGGDRAPTDGRVSASPSIDRVDIYAAWKAVLPPASAPPIVAGKRTPPLANPKRPEKPPTHYTPKAVYPYTMADGRLIGYVLRVEIGGKKLTPLVLWCENQETGELTWCHRPLAEPRRLYALPEFIAKPEGQVLIVEGEKCAEAGKRLMPKLVVTTWQGGGKAAQKADWRPVGGRDVVIWPDNDEPGEATAQAVARLCLDAGARSVKIIAAPGEDKPEGWDIADAEAEGWTTADVIRFARAGARLWTRSSRPEEPRPGADRDACPPARASAEQGKEAPALKPTTQEKPKPTPAVKPIPRPDPEKPDNVVLLPNARIPEPEEGDEQHWMSYLELDANNKVRPKLMVNYIEYLHRHPMMRGVLIKNAFTTDVILQSRPPWDRGGGKWRPRKLADHDVTMAVTWLERAQMTPKHNECGTAIYAVAEKRKFDPVRDYLNGLVWDGVPRIQGGEGQVPWLYEYMGVKQTEHAVERAFGMRWLIAAVSRNLTDNVDGEKVDNMLVFEGEQGKLKSTALETIATIGGVRYFQDNIEDLSSKDSVMQLQGKLIVEIAELDAINKAGTDTVKKWLSRRVDSIRLPYGKIVSDLPRRAVIAGTVNLSGRGYLKDATGARRFWPTYIAGSIDMDNLKRDRDQLWAEAVHLYRAGEKWWLQGDEDRHAAIEQRKRFQADPWAGILDEWLSVNGDTVTLNAAFHALEIPIHMRSTAHEARIVSHLISSGYVRGTKTFKDFPVAVFRKKRDG